MVGSSRHNQEGPRSERRRLRLISFFEPRTSNLQLSALKRTSNFQLPTSSCILAAALTGGAMDLWSRRKFFLTSLAGSAAAGVSNLFGRTTPLETGSNGAPGRAPAAQGKRPLIISSANGVNALGHGMDILKKSGDTLDAVVAAVTVVEDDPNGDSVGYGGLPNEEGEVELDASVMHGPTHRAGSVASVRRIKNVSRLAKTVMEKTNHVMIVGDGARRFAVAEGFEEKNLLTEHSRKIWLAWKAKSSFNWRPGIDSPEWKAKSAAARGSGPLDSEEFHERLADICGH